MILRILIAKIAIYEDLYHKEHPKLNILKDAIRSLTKDTGCTAQLCSALAGKYIVVYEFMPDSEFSINSNILAHNIPITWTASGRLLLNYTSKKQLERKLSLVDLKSPNHNSINLDTLLAEIILAHKHNFFQQKSFFIGVYNIQIIFMFKEI